MTYRKQGVNDLEFPKRIMRFVSDKSKVTHLGQGNISIECPDLWEMTIADFESVFGVKIKEVVTTE